MRISSGRPRRRYQEEIRGGSRRWQGEPSACDASLAPVKGEGEGRRAGDEEPSTRAQFQERFSQDNVGEVTEPKASSRKSPVLKKKQNQNLLSCTASPHHHQSLAGSGWGQGDVVLDSEGQQLAALCSPQQES